MTWRLNSGLNDLCFLMTRPFLPFPGPGDPVCHSNTSVQSMGFSATSSNVIKYLFGFSALTAHNVTNQSVMIGLLNYLDR
jgi:hypothetical protein